ncbi:MAG: hypothetical protein AAFN70_03600 [Planctomycetota bacterium]
MPYRFLRIPVADAQQPEKELSSFLAQHRIINIERQDLNAGESSFGAICVDFLGVGTGIGKLRGASVIGRV